MSKSKEQLQQSVLDVGEQFAASMDKLLVTELNYLKYLRDRKRFHIGVRNIMSNGLGSGKFPDDPNPTPRRNPRGPRGFGGERSSAREMSGKRGRVTSDNGGLGLG